MTLCRFASFSERFMVRMSKTVLRCFEQCFEKVAVIILAINDNLTKEPSARVTCLPYPQQEAQRQHNEMEQR